jgi:hypothetical protein
MDDNAFLPATIAEFVVPENHRPSLLPIVANSRQNPSFCRKVDAVGKDEAGRRDFYCVDGGFARVLRYVAEMSSKLRAMLAKVWTNCQASQSVNAATPI